MKTTFKDFLNEDNDSQFLSNIDKEELIDKIKPEFNGDYDDSKLEVDDYIDRVEELYNNGGEVYRLVFLNKKEDLNTKDLGEHWTIDIGVFGRFFNSLESGRKGKFPFLITAQIEPKQIDVKNSVETFLQLPQENEILLKYPPKEYKIKKY